jgi:hypothetical protein
MDDFLSQFFASLSCVTRESVPPLDSCTQTDEQIAEESTVESRVERERTRLDGDCCICLEQIRAESSSVICHCCLNSMHFECALRLRDVRCPNCRETICSRPPHRPLRRILSPATSDLQVAHETQMRRWRLPFEDNSSDEDNTSWSMRNFHRQEDEYRWDNPVPGDRWHWLDDVYFRGVRGVWMWNFGSENDPNYASRATYSNHESCEWIRRSNSWIYTSTESYQVAFTLVIESLNERFAAENAARSEASERESTN